MAYNLSCFLLLSKSRWLFSTQIYLRKLNKENFIVTNDIWFIGSQFLFMICIFQAVHSALQHEATHQNAQVSNKYNFLYFLASRQLKLQIFNKTFHQDWNSAPRGASGGIQVGRLWKVSDQLQHLPPGVKSSLFEVKRNYDSVLLNLVLCKRHFLKRKKMLSVCTKKTGRKS